MLGALWVGSGTQILLEQLPRSPPPLPLTWLRWPGPGLTNLS